MPHDNTVHIKVKFDRKIAFRAYEKLNGEITEDDGGNLYDGIKIPNDYNLCRYIFSFGENVEVLEPEEIRLKMKEKNGAKIYTMTNGVKYNEV